MDLIPLIKDGLVIYGAYKALTEIGTRVLAFSKRPKIYSFDSLSSMTTAFFDDSIRPGEYVSITGRFSKYGHIYHPWALYQNDQRIRSSWMTQPTDKHRLDGSYKLIEVDERGKKNEFHGAAFFPPFPLSALPTSRIGNQEIGVGFLYPKNAEGAGAYVKEYSKSIPVIYAHNSDVPSWENSVVSLKARIDVLSKEVEKAITSPDPAISKNLHDRWYRPLSPGHNGFCLSLIDENGKYDTGSSIDLPSNLVGIPVSFHCYWGIQYHLENTNLSHIDRAQREKTAHLVQDIIRQSIREVNGPWETSNISMGINFEITDFHWTVGRLEILLTEPNHLLVLLRLDLVTEYDEVTDLFPKLTAKLVKGIGEIYSDVLHQSCSIALDFLYNFGHQRYFLPEGALASKSVLDCTSQSKVLQKIRDWLRETEDEKA